MKLSAGERWQEFVDRIAREAKLTTLRDTIRASIERAGDVSGAELDAAIEAKSDDLRAQGIGA